MYISRILLFLTLPSLIALSFGCSSGPKEEIVTEEEDNRTLESHHPQAKAKRMGGNFSEFVEYEKSPDPQDIFLRDYQRLPNNDMNINEALHKLNGRWETGCLTTPMRKEFSRKFAYIFENGTYQKEWLHYSDNFCKTLEKQMITGKTDLGNYRISYKDVDQNRMYFFTRRSRGGEVLSAQPVRVYLATAANEGQACDVNMVWSNCKTSQLNVQSYMSFKTTENGVLYDGHIFGPNRATKYASDNVPGCEKPHMVGQEAWCFKFTKAGPGSPKVKSEDIIEDDDSEGETSEEEESAE